MLDPDKLVTLADFLRQGADKAEEFAGALRSEERQGRLRGLGRQMAWIGTELRQMARELSAAQGDGDRPPQTR